MHLLDVCSQLSDVKEKLGVNYQNLVKAKQRETGLQSVSSHICPYMEIGHLIRNGVL